MWGFLRHLGRDGGHVEHQTPPREVVSMDSLAHETRWLEERIESVDRQIADAVADGDWPRVDRLLDYRNALRRPQVGTPPVIPGRVTVSGRPWTGEDDQW
jgi:hypothetical protein